MTQKTALKVIKRDRLDPIWIITEEFGCLHVVFVKLTAYGISQWIFEAGGPEVTPFVGFNPAIISTANHLGLFVDTSVCAYEHVVKEAQYSVFPGVAVRLRGFQSGQITACFPKSKWALAQLYHQIKIKGGVP